MIWFFIAAAAWAGTTYAVYCWPKDIEAKIGFSSIYGMVTLLFVPFLGYAGAASTTGVMPGYSVGQRTGYVIKLSRKGVIWKTTEGSMQLSTGEAASLQQPFNFSVADPEVLNDLEQVIGTDKRVRLFYSEWLIMPWWIGESGYEVTAVEQIPQGGGSR